MTEVATTRTWSLTAPCPTDDVLERVRQLGRDKDLTSRCRLLVEGESTFFPWAGSGMECARCGRRHSSLGWCGGVACAATHGARREQRQSSSTLPPALLLSSLLGYVPRVFPCMRFAGGLVRLVWSFRQPKRLHNVTRLVDGLGGTWVASTAAAFAALVSSGTTLVEELSADARAGNKGNPGARVACTRLPAAASRPTTVRALARARFGRREAPRGAGDARVPCPYEACTVSSGRFTSREAARMRGSELDEIG